jgi:prepilin-type N-terminal cleavage/methylation domain-containing protein
MIRDRIARGGGFRQYKELFYSKYNTMGKSINSDQKCPNYRSLLTRANIRGARTAFTLIEVMAVIAILAVLVSVSLLGVREIKIRALNTKCVANLRSIGLAIGCYAADHGGQVPGPCYGSIPATYSNALNGPYVLTVYLTGYLDAAPQENSLPHFCPAMLCPAFDYKDTLIESQWDKARSYELVYQLSGVALPGGEVPSPWGRPQTPGLNMNTRPMKLMTIAELVNPATTWAVKDADASTSGGVGLSPEPVHGGHWNRLYFDFHVAATSGGLP